MTDAKTTTQLARLASDSRMPLVLLPFAGANQHAYRALESLLVDTFECMTFELPGRGRRFSEKPLDDLRALVADLRGPIIDRLNGRRYVLFGHSMGARLAYLLAHELPKAGARPPLHLLVSASRAPGRPAQIIRHTLSSPRLTAELRAMGGTTDAFLASPELVQLFEPVLRADFKAVETFERGDAPPLSCPITAFRGAADDVTMDDTEAWREETTGSFEVHTLAGGHFFLFEDRVSFAKLLTAALANCLPHTHEVSSHGRAAARD